MKIQYVLLSLQIVDRCSCKYFLVKSLWPMLMQYRNKGKFPLAALVPKVMVIAEQFEKARHLAESCEDCLDLKSFPNC